MNIDEIIYLINYRLTYKLGWKFKAVRKVTPTGEYVKVYYEYYTDDSDPDMRGQLALNDGEFDVWVGSEEHVEIVILKALLSAEAHETAEFMRIDRHAPFHPHRIDGVERYQEAQDITTGLPTLPPPSSDPGIVGLGVEMAQFGVGF